MDEPPIRPLVPRPRKSTPALQTSAGFSSSPPTTPPRSILKSSDSTPVAKSRSSSGLTTISSTSSTPSPKPIQKFSTFPSTQSTPSSNSIRKFPTQSSSAQSTPLSKSISKKTTHSSIPSSPSSSIPTKTEKASPDPDPIRRTPTSKLKEDAFFAFVLLPLSCWYTRGGKRLKELDELADEPCRPREGRLDQSSRRRRNTVAGVPPRQQMVKMGSLSVPVPMHSPGPERE